MYNIIFLINEMSKIMTVSLEHSLLLVVDDGSGLKIDIYSHWVAMHTRLRHAFNICYKYH